MPKSLHKSQCIKLEHFNVCSECCDNINEYMAETSPTFSNKTVPSIATSFVLLECRSLGQWASSGKVPSNFVEALQRQYMLDVDNRIGGLQRMLTNDLSKSLPSAIAKHRVMKWDSSLKEEQVAGVMCDLSVIKEGEQPGSLPADVDVQQLLVVASTMLPWCCLHAYYELEGTLLFVKQILESDSGVHSSGGLPEVA